MGYGPFGDLIMPSTDIDGKPIIIFGKEDAKEIYRAIITHLVDQGSLASIARRIRETFNLDSKRGFQRGRD